MQLAKKITRQGRKTAIYQSQILVISLYINSQRLRQFHEISLSTFFELETKITTSRPIILQLFCRFCVVVNIAIQSKINQVGTRYNLWAALTVIRVSSCSTQAVLVLFLRSRDNQLVKTLQTKFVWFQTLTDALYFGAKVSFQNNENQNLLL